MCVHVMVYSHVHVYIYCREDVREYGFGVIIDARSSNWHSTKLILHSLQEVLPGQVYKYTSVGASARKIIPRFVNSGLFASPYFSKPNLTLQIYRVHVHVKCSYMCVQ